MHITATCPRCQSHYQVEPNLRGKFMRCPNALCRAVFEVKEPEPAARGPERSGPHSAPPQQVSGSVGDIVPMLTAESTSAPVEPLPLSVEDDKGSAHVQDVVPLLPAEAVDHRPPTRKRAAKPPRQEPAPSPPEWDGTLTSTEPVLAEASPATTAEGIRELPPGAWEAPPVRVPGAAVVADPPGPAVPLPRAPARERRARRRSRRLILAVLVLVAGGLAGGLYLVRGRQAEDESQRFQRAEKLYQDHEFADAVLRLQNLVRDFPESKERRRYLFLAELGDVRDPVYHPQGDAAETARTHDRLLQFLEVYRDDPLLSQHQHDVHHTLLRLARELSSWAGQKHDRSMLARARQALTQAGQFEAAAASNSGPMRRELEAGLAAAENTIAASEKRTALLGAVQEIARKPSAAAVQEVRALVQQAGLAEDADVTQLLKQLVQAHAASVTYVEAFRAARTDAFAEERAPSLRIVPALREGRVNPPGTDATPSAPVLALARGVLYALDPHDGQAVWCRRVGADTTQLPLRLPATPIAPECLLVLSSDHKTLTSVTARDGAVVWQQQLSDACLGQPVLVGKHVLVPTQSGRVEEIETTEGRLLGAYELGQRLSVGGVHQPGTSLVYFPADQFTIYIVDVARRACAGVLYSGHPRGSLRSAPLVLSDPDASVQAGEATSPGAAGWLLLSQVDGDAVKLRLFHLPITQPDQPALPLDVRIQGSSDFPPRTDGERLALASDAGIFSLWGVKQKGTREPLLFPLLKDDVVLGKAGRSDLGSGLVAHADAENFWVLAQGKLHRLQNVLSPEAGPGKMARAWSEPPFLGMPLHASQLSTRVPGTVFLTTQLAGRATCLASAVDTQQGTLHWQRQLGLVCQGQPVALGDRVLVQDAGGVLLFDASKLALDKGQSWQAAGQGLLSIAAPETVHLVTDASGTRAVALVDAGPKTMPRVRVVDLGMEPPSKPVEATLPAALAGTPALGGEAVIVPLRDGILARVGTDGSVARGPHWRAAGVDDQEHGYVTAANGDHFLATDGSRGLSLLHWATPKVWETKASAQLSRRIAAAPVVLPGPDLRIAVADAADEVTLLQGERLRIVRRWNLGGKITAGPFARGNGIGCVVGKQRLVWLDPERDQPVWEYTFVAPIVGQPPLVDGQLVVADLAGQFVALDAASGRAVGPGYRLRANVAPASAPVPLGPSRLFTPQTDGTVLLLALEDLRHPLQTFPVLP